MAFLNGVYYQSRTDGNQTTPSENDKINWRIIRTYSHWTGGFTYQIDAADERKNAYVYDLDSNNEPTVWKALESNSNKTPRENPRFWVQADVCGKLLSSCKSRYQANVYVRSGATGNLTNIADPNPKSIADREGSTNRTHGLSNVDSDSTVKLPFGGFPGTRRLR